MGWGGGRKESMDGGKQYVLTNQTKRVNESFLNVSLFEGKK